jgi:hypothetical protein
MFCPKCATQNTEEAKFCRSCGTDISLVPQAVSGHLAERLAAGDDDTRHGRRRRHRERDERRPPRLEHAVKHLFMGFAFILVAFSVKTWAPAGSVWWFWMFLPAFALLADGVSTLIRLKEYKQEAAPPQHQTPPAAVPAPRRVSALPPRDTGEIIAPPPSVTEGTTRHLGVPVERTRGDV